MSGPSPSQENGPSPPSFSGTAYVSRCPVTKEDSAGPAHSENTTCWRGDTGVPPSSGWGLASHLPVHLLVAHGNLPLMCRTTLPCRPRGGCPGDPWIITDLCSQLPALKGTPWKQLQFSGLSLEPQMSTKRCHTLRPDRLSRPHPPEPTANHSLGANT